MITLQADDKRLLKVLAWCVETAEVYDKDGKLIGVFVPANLDQLRAKYAQLQALVERDRPSFQNSDPRDTVAHGEVVANLKALNQESERRQLAGEQPFTLEEAKTFLRTGYSEDQGPATASTNSN